MFAASYLVRRTCSARDDTVIKRRQGASRPFFFGLATSAEGRQRKHDLKGQRVLVFTGTVKWVKEAKGYGFIKRDDGPGLFVHYTNI